MDRIEALKLATEYVTQLATNARGYQDGVSFADKIDAVERIAQFLIGPNDDQKTVDRALPTVAV